MFGLKIGELLFPCLLNKYGVECLTSDIISVNFTMIHSPCVHDLKVGIVINNTVDTNNASFPSSVSMKLIPHPLKDCST